MGSHIQFKTVRFQNLFSYGNNVTEVDLSVPQLHLIVGDSGAGKSTVLDAIMFGLFGKPYKKVVKSSIINSINGKGTLVEIVFETGGNQFLVRRGIKPTIFEIEKNGELMDKDAKALDMQKNLEAYILGGIDSATFLQTAIIGSANFVPFMQLTTSERRKMVETMLSLSIFSKSSDITKARIKTAEAVRSDQFSNERVAQTKLDGMRNTLRLLLEQKAKSETSNDGLIATLELKLAKYVDEKADLIGRVKLIKEDLIATKIDIGPIEDSDELTKQGRDKSYALKTIKEKIALWDEGSCPTCGQELSKDSEGVFDYEGAVKEVEQTMALLEDLKDRVAVSRQNTSTLETLNSNGKSLVNKISTLESSISDTESSLESFKSQPKTSFDPQSIVDIEEQIKLADEEKTSLQESVAVAEEDVKYLKMCGELFKDSGIKANIVKVFIPLLNQTINEYLQEFEMDVVFEFDEEFNETIRGRGRDDYSYNNLSEGEKRRVDLAVLFSWLKIGELKNSANMNLLCADEIMDASLDFTAVQNLVKIMQRLIRDKGKSIFVISHREELKEAFFDEVIMVKKEGQFSQLEVGNNE